MHDRIYSALAEASRAKIHTDSDLERYRHHLDKFDLTDEQKFELIGTLRAIVETIIDKKYGLSNPVSP